MMVAAALGLFGLMGFISGALRQLSHLIGLILGYAAMHFFAGLLAPMAAARFGWSPALAQIGASLALFYGVYAAAAFIAHLMLEKVLGIKKRSFWDQAGGLVLGAGKAAAAVYVLLSAVVFLEKPLAKIRPDFPKEAKESKSVEFVRAHNLFASLRLPPLPDALKAKR